MQHKTIWIVLTAAVAIALGAFWLGRQHDTADAPEGQFADGVVQGSSGKRVLYWHDPMVPGPKFDKPGKSPFMDMALVPKYAGDEAEAGVKISSGVAQNLGVRTGKAEVGSLESKLVAVGRVAFDERDIRSVQIRSGGFIERLYVRAVGDPVTAGQKVADVYAPDLLAAQHELLALAKLQDVPDLDDLKTAARQRLLLLGMSEAEISDVQDSATPRRNIGLYAPMAGVVQDLGMREGAQVMPGQTLMQIAGLSRVWVVADLPERDLARVQRGHAASMQIAAIPQQVFKGHVEYVYPKLDEAARTGQVRIQLANPKGLLRPGMYAQMEFAAAKRDVLSVPTEAVIATGTRSVVIVREHDMFRPAEVKTGSEIGGRTEILSGLKAGEEVVLSGQFLIDSEASLKGVLARLGAAKPETVAAAPKAQAVSGSGVVKEVDTAKGTVTLSHGPMPAMQWPAMTMSFKLRDPKAAQRLKLGAAVAFEVKREAEDGSYIIESIKEAAP